MRNASGVDGGRPLGGTHGHKNVGTEGRFASLVSNVRNALMIEHIGAGKPARLFGVPSRPGLGTGQEPPFGIAVCGSPQPKASQRAKRWLAFSFGIKGILFGREKAAAMLLTSVLRGGGFGEHHAVWRVTLRRHGSNLDQCARGSGRTWMCTARGEEPLPVSISHGVRSPFVLQSPRPFHPAFGSSIRAARPLAKKLTG